MFGRYLKYPQKKRENELIKNRNAAKCKLFWYRCFNKSISIAICAI